MSATVLAETRAGLASQGYYDPATGQFLTPNPLYAVTGERYGCAGNDPIDSDDPSGLCYGINNKPCPGSSTVRHVAQDVAAAPGHVAHDISNDVIKPVGRNACVTVANSNCESYGSSTTWGHDVLVGSELMLGAALLVASFGTLAVPEVGAFGLTASQTSQLIALGSIGNGASALPRCFAGDGVARAVAGLGIGAGGLGLTGLGASEWALGACAFGRVSGLLGWTLNATYRLSRAVCHR